MIPSDILTVAYEHRFDTDEIDMRLVSHRLSYRGGVRFTAMEAPPEVEAINLTLMAFGPLFQAYANLPFSERIVQPLLLATMDRLLPEHQRRLLEVSRYYLPHRRPRQVLVRDPNPRVENFIVQGNNARILMDQLEAAFRVREVEGGLVSLARGEVIPEPAEPEVFLQGFGDPREPRTVTATETRMRGDWARAFERQFEAAVLYGDSAREVYRGPSVQAVAIARETLVHCLSPVQRAEFEREGRFTVVASNGKMFTVLQEDVYNVEDREWRYCCVPQNQRIPVFDKMLASKLWLEGEYERFMQTANKIHKSTGEVVGGRPARGFAWMGALPIMRPDTIVRLDTGA